MKILAALFALGLLTVPSAAIDLSNESPSAQVAVDATCKSIESEFAEAAQYQWFVTKSLSGKEAEDFLKRYNETPPASNAKASVIHLLNRVGVAQTGVVFVDDKGCVRNRFFINKATLEKFLGITV